MCLSEAIRRMEELHGTERVLSPAWDIIIYIAVPEFLELAQEAASGSLRMRRTAPQKSAG